MKLHFEANLDYQLAAIEAVCDLFRGQEICRTEFTVTRPSAKGQMEAWSLGVGNRLGLISDQVEENLRAVQLRHGLAPSGPLTSGDFTVEMETGTGKTYVYLRTLFELNKRFGFTKFVIVVPSVAIREGVYKSLQITEEHFRALYAGTVCEYFAYDSAKLGQVRNFATSPSIQVMVVTVQAINKKDVAKVYKDSEQTGGEKPIDLIRATRPIVIIDEPQSVDGPLERGAGKAAVDAMKPLCTLRYSATHLNPHHMVYRLDAVDAYEQKLVKQIEVAAATVEDAHNKPFVRLEKTENKRGTISAVLWLDKATAAGGVSRCKSTVLDGDDLQLTTGRAVYANCRVGEIRAAKGGGSVQLRVPGSEVVLGVGEPYGDVNSLVLQQEMIRRTIREHLDKELRLRPLGIKVLSLFFIDEVAKYRQYDADGRKVKGPYARIFEEEYARAATFQKYRGLFKEVDLGHAADAVHDGYFSIDKKGSWTDTAENNDTNRANAERAYNLIMKDKELLLSLDTPLKFIFSHSALREGWDNPNVFQICALRDMHTERERRQTIGRGLRLCVNQEGQRVRGFEVNTLTVIAMESYERFAEGLQRELEADTGIRFGVVAPEQFAALAVVDGAGTTTALGHDKSKALCEGLREAGYLDKRGNIQDSLRRALKDGTFAVPQAFKDQQPQVAALLKKLAGRLEVKNADERRPVRTRRAVLDSAEFKALWDRVKHKTTYRVEFDNERLILQCIADLAELPDVPRTRLQWRKADLTIGKAGVEATERTGASTVALDEGDMELPDLLTELQDRTQLTRRSIYRILTESGRLDQFERNPQEFIAQVAKVILYRKRRELVDGIKYQRLGDGAEHYYAQELFEEKELTGYLRNLLPAERSVYEDIVYDSDVEKSFAEQLHNNDAVKVYAKLPGWFTVPTPLGAYNPDWAVLVEHEGGERLYLVVETKSGLFKEDLREAEKAKTKCAKEHFKALALGENPARYSVATKLSDALSED